MLFRLCSSSVPSLLNYYLLNVLCAHINTHLRTLIQLCTGVYTHLYMNIDMTTNLYVYDKSIEKEYPSVQVVKILAINLYIWTQVKSGITKSNCALFLYKFSNILQRCIHILFITAYCKIYNDATCSC